MSYSGDGIEMFPCPPSLQLTKNLSLDLQEDVNECSERF
jgi:hypothetical protein